MMWLKSVLIADMNTNIVTFLYVQGVGWLKRNENVVIESVRMENANVNIGNIVDLVSPSYAPTILYRNTYCRSSFGGSFFSVYGVLA
jgi:hypothetical protein